MLSAHFSLEELTITQVRGIDNTPPRKIEENLRLLAMGLEDVRAILGAPILINSGYRCRGVNQAVGGVFDSAHLSGWAADFICPAFGTPLAICTRLAQAALTFDQMIEEGTWVHYSIAPTFRHQILTKDGRGGYRIGLPQAMT